MICAELDHVWVLVFLAGCVLQFLAAGVWAAMALKKGTPR